MIEREWEQNGIHSLARRWVVFPQEEIEGFRRYWRRRKPHTSTVLHYASDVTLFFEWVKDVAPREISIHHIDQL